MFTGFFFFQRGYNNGGPPSKNIWGGAWIGGVRCNFPQRTKKLFSKVVFEVISFFFSILKRWWLLLEINVNVRHMYIIKLCMINRPGCQQITYQFTFNIYIQVVYSYELFLIVKEIFTSFEYFPILVFYTKLFISRRLIESKNVHDHPT